MYSVQIQENTDQKNSVFGHFSHSDKFAELLAVVGRYLIIARVIKRAPRHTFTCSKSTTETLEKGVKYVQS